MLMNVVVFPAPPFPFRKEIIFVAVITPGVIKRSSRDYGMTRYRHQYQ